MAILQSTDRLEQMIGNKYSLVIVAAKRSRQLKEGHPALSEDPTTSSLLSIALREIEEDKIHPVAPPEEELAPAPRDVISSLVAGADFDLDDEMDLEDSDAVDDLAALLVGTDDDDDEAESDNDVLAPVASPVNEENDDDVDAEDEVDTDDTDDVEDTDDEDEEAEEE